MPTYQVYCRAGQFSEQALAGRLTATHRAHTGAPASFVQVLFHELGAQFIGGRPVPEHGVFVHGQIRDGRTTEVRAALTLAIRDAVIEVASVPPELVWVYLVELPYRQMVEFGRTLPAAGDEQRWLDGLPAPLRERLTALDEQAAQETG